jgi:hypothetical protein
LIHAKERTVDIQPHSLGSVFGRQREIHYELPLGTAAEPTEDGKWHAVILLGKGSGSPAIWTSTESYAGAEQADAAARKRLAERHAEMLA